MDKLDEILKRLEAIEKRLDGELEELKKQPTYAPVYIPYQPNYHESPWRPYELWC